MRNFLASAMAIAMALARKFLIRGRFLH